MGLKADKIVLASHNDGKVKELARLLEPYHINVLAAKNFNPPLKEIEETGKTFAANASLKASAAAQESGLIALSDDSGLEVEALGGAPGIYSARYAEQKGKRNFTFACDKIWQEIEELKTDNYRAAFVCALALAYPLGEGEVKIYQGRVEGTIVYPPRGQKGFGYDPIFVPRGYQETFGEMEPSAKHLISHRARAFALFIEAELK
jgi:XTP/dITP diphosphohydrolase